VRHSDPVTDEPTAGPPPPSPEEIAEELDTAAEEHTELLAQAEQAEHADHVEHVEEERRYPSTIGGAFYLVVLAVGAVGLGIVYTGDWRLGIRCLAAGLCCAALLRLVLPARDAGMLAVRNRLLDVLLLGGFGAAILFLASTIPNQPS
jgi:hypothetical protein